MNLSWAWVVSKFDILFSGLGVYVISLVVSIFVVILAFIFRKSRASANKVSMNNIKAGGDVVGRDKKGS